MKMTDIKDYKGLYSITEDGQVYSHRWKRVLSLNKNNKGYYYVTFKKRGSRKNHLVHRLVAGAFIENAENKRCVNHIDGNKTNNNISNLEWCTHSENNKHAYSIGLKCHKGKNNPNHKSRKREKKVKDD